MAKILIVDDEPRIRELIHEHLQYSGYICEEAGDGSAALAQLSGGGFDLVILDLMMPFMDGMTCLREMRARHINTPVIILTARGEEYDKLAGLESGADDYVVKPFSPRELVARVRAVLNRTMPRTPETANTMTFGELTIDTASHTVRVSGEEVALTPKEFDLLVFLASNKGIALSREKILQKVWNYDYFGDDRTVDTHVKMLRGHLGKCRSMGSFVQTLNPPRLSGSAQLLVGRTTADGSYTVLVTTSLVHVAEAGKVLSTLLPLAAALIFGFAMSAAWLFSEWFTKPLRQLSSAARQMALGNYAVQVDTRRNDELGDLARDFNHMAEEVQHAVQMQRDLLANVSHDLRTPLTLIKGYAETVRDLTGDDKAHRDEQMNIIVDEADRLTALVSSVMERSKVTSGTYKCERVHFDTGQLCDEVSERYDAVCAQNGWQLQLELPEEELPVYADPDMMQRALHNLLGNAMHHIGKDGIFILRAFRCTEGVRVEVEDHGPGIAAADLPYIFDRYYRSRSDAGKQGTGLGLSITKAIFQQHSFRFGVQSTVGKGTTFWFVMSDLPYVDDFEGK